jgi:hypothetical protein
MALTDKERAEIMGMSLAAYHKLMVANNDDAILRDAIKTERKEKLADVQLEQKALSDLESMDRNYIAPFGDGTAVVPVKRGNPHDPKVYDAKNIEMHWTKYPSSIEDKALFYGYHIHSKDNPYGLHTHMPGGKLGGSHKHGPQNARGQHTHKLDIEDVPTNLLLNPVSPIYLDGDHEHMENFIDGPHSHKPLNFG